MTEENKTPKNKWSRILRKKWFFPAVYLTVAALLLSLVVWYQNLDNQMNQSQEEPDTEDYTPVEHDREAKPVMDQQEIIQRPVENMDQAEIVTKYYDYDADQKEQENALVVFNNRYYQSTGIDIAADDGETFDVQASLSGKVTEVKEDPLMGNKVTLTHENGVTTHYASLGKVNVSAEDQVEQGDVLGTAGESLFGKDNGTHVHFEIRKDEEAVNPETFFNQPVSALDEVMTDDEKSEEEEENTDSDKNEKNAESDDSKKSEESSKEENESDKSDESSDQSDKTDKEEPSNDEEKTEKPDAEGENPTDSPSTSDNQ
ncbi:M23 family metallopeptidase [Lentibacillus cibarius]|uniref:M23 family metallopeptidase n=1 Tax=Lentibacillus cibarius TaxID=2583219 RepID=A0A549YFT0_9BACI|nr:M23 family metallopeptidase [Lentibacillus cibarius]TMN21979.1 M23 family metallopeptidase [Lentibacillus cibarius]TRM10744.1 M23 family metallopeptidase [Lentibacillus cibarius]